jgi:hypothetical protein
MNRKGRKGLSAKVRKVLTSAKMESAIIFMTFAKP